MEMSYSWAMPNHQTFKIKPIKQFIEENMIEGLTIDPFANRKSDFGAITNDLNPNAETDFHMDALQFLKTFDDNSISNLFFDPPYSLRQIKECYEGLGVSLTQRESQRFYSDLKDEIKRIMKIGGVVFSFGWSSVGMTKSRGFEKIKLLCCSHGGIHNDTLVLLEVFHGIA